MKTEMYEKCIKKRIEVYVEISSKAQNKKCEVSEFTSHCKCYKYALSTESSTSSG